MEYLVKEQPCWDEEAVALAQKTDRQTDRQRKRGFKRGGVSLSGWDGKHSPEQQGVFIPGLIDAAVAELKTRCVDWSKVGFWRCSCNSVHLS